VSLGQRLEKVKGHERTEQSTSSLGSKEHTFTLGSKVGSGWKGDVAQPYRVHSNRRQVQSGEWVCLGDVWLCQQQMSS
jgi:hypothetical protein